MESTGVGASAFGFTGEQRDATGLMFLRARYYAPGMGQFTSRDPFAGWAEQPVSLHPYQYGYSNPLRYTDPTGWCAKSENRLAGCPPWLPDTWFEIATSESSFGKLLWNFADVANRVDQAAPWISLGSDFTPVVGDVKGLAEVFTGYDLVTEEDLGNWRWLGIIAASELRHVDEVVEAADACRKVANSVTRGADRFSLFESQLRAAGVEGAELVREHTKLLDNARGVCNTSACIRVATLEGLRRPIEPRAILEIVSGLKENPNIDHTLLVTLDDAGTIMVIDKTENLGRIFGNEIPLNQYLKNVVKKTRFQTLEEITNAIMARELPKSAFKEYVDDWPIIDSDLGQKNILRAHLYDKRGINVNTRIRRY